jgi:hypothetical protein
MRRMEQALALNPKAIWIYRNVVPAYSELGEQKKAEDRVSVLLQDYPQLTVSAVSYALVFHRSFERSRWPASGRVAPRLITSTDNPSP